MSNKKSTNLFFRFDASVLPYFTIFFIGIYSFRFPSLIISVIDVMLLSWLSAFLLKIIFHKLRPHHKKAQAPFREESRFSFPSEHSAIFSALGVFSCVINPILGAVLIFVAILIGASRAIIGVHFWRDIIAGWALGAIIALLFIFWLHFL